MLPKERMIAALDHREADRVPLGETGADWEIAERALGRPTFYRSKWKEWVAEWEGQRDAVVASYQQDIPALAKTFEWDFVVVPLVPPRHTKPAKPEMLGDYKWRDEKGRVWQYAPEAGGHPMLLEGPALEAKDIVVPERVPVDESRLEAIRHIVKEIGGTHFVFGRAPDGTFPWAETVGMEEYLIRMASDPEFTTKSIAAYMKTSLAWIDAIAETGVDGILVATDYCDNVGPLMGGRLFRQYVLPAFRETVQGVHAKGKYFVKHTDGNTWSILDDFVAAGVDGWQGIQPRIRMDLKLLKEKYAGKLCFFGGVNCETLTLGTLAEVEAEVQHAIRYAGPGGGLVITSGNTLQVGTKWENYAAMRAAARRYGSYPINA
ncbi:MAG TPA: uroporphyrinogen decarboxylase family protein [Candidatus Baltobacteraceae bacterium]|nr:uroporphyrinogen decarboxylase family protein [Candidatus Baltobacteraceae bacterium]